MKVRVFDAVSQKHALTALAELTSRAIEQSPIVRETAIALITDRCADRDDDCQLEAIFDAVKHGDDRINGLEKGFRYVSDPVLADYFTAPGRSLDSCARGACGGDCDDHAALVASLAGAVGFDVGLRAWGRFGKEFEHVYAVAKTPKHGVGRVVGLDTTYPNATVGWEPPQGRVMTAWLVAPSRIRTTETQPQPQNAVAGYRGYR